MDQPSPNPLTAEQIAALEAGGGVMFGEDPATHRLYLLIEQVEPTVDDDYVREKLDEAQASIDRGEAADWDVEDIKAEVKRRMNSQGRAS
jgi:hypothetical protein